MQGEKFAVVMFARDNDATVMLEKTDLRASMGKNGAGQAGGWKDSGSLGSYTVVITRRRPRAGSSRRMCRGEML
jgi:hypothetical protein